MSAAVLLLFTLNLVAPPSVSAGSSDTPLQLIEAVVATVNRSVITLGQVEAEARMVLVRRGGAQGAHQRIDDGLRAAVLEYLINQEVVLAEARRLKLFGVEPAQVRAEAARIEGSFASRSAYLTFLHDNGLSEGDVADIVRRDLRVGRFLKSRVQVLARLDEGELRIYYAAHPELYGERSFAQVRDTIEQKLGRQRHEQAIRDWVSELKSRAQIRVLRSFGEMAQPADR